MRLQTKACVVGTLLLAIGCAYKSSFSDQILEQRFRSNQTDFVRLLQMFKEDSSLSKVTREAAYLSYDLKANLPRQRLDDYCAMLSKLNLGSISRGEQTGNIYFAAWNKSDFIIGGTNEYYVYADSAPAEARYLVDSLNELRKKTDAYAFKKIADHWYLHVDNW